MWRRVKPWPIHAAWLIIVATMVTTARLDAHDAHVVGPYRIEIGWSDEPAFSGARNAVVVEVTDAVGRTPVTDLGGGSLSAEVTFGDQRVVLPLRRSQEHRNQFEASIVPTRPGTYAFHITGRVKSQPIDIRSACSDRTFDCVISAGDIQFPARDPSAGELAERLAKSSPRADHAIAVADRALTFSIVALAGAALALAAAVAAVRFGAGGRRP
jgi:hypothetical protein